MEVSKIYGPHISNDLGTPRRLCIRFCRTGKNAWTLESNPGCEKVGLHNRISEGKMVVKDSKAQPYLLLWKQPAEFKALSHYWCLITSKA